MALTLAAYGQYADHLSPEWWEGYRQNVVEALTSDGPGRQFVAERAGRVLGSVLYYPGGSTRTGDPSVRLLAVIPEARGHGIARALMDRCVEEARAEGAAALVLHTMQMMDVARGMYERMGFRRVPDYDFRPLENELVLGYRLDLPMP